MDPERTGGPGAGYAGLRCIHTKGRTSDSTTRPGRRPALPLPPFIHIHIRIRTFFRTSPEPRPSSHRTPLKQSPIALHTFPLERLWTCPDPFPLSTHLRRGQVITSALHIRNQRVAPAATSSLSQPRDPLARALDTPAARASYRRLVSAVSAAAEPGCMPASDPDAKRCSESESDPPRFLPVSPDPPSLSSSSRFTETLVPDAVPQAAPDSGAASASGTSAASSVASATASSAALSSCPASRSAT
ncbi:hypothetical protein Vretifemale_18912 [Volvox reticuliferus]|uniref:Uncharacterized protein n=1 Tax=Volvox reticuliferus TaxID=1737510 RepID=A0A8J4FVV6_9CHLO|nr:hypothetical protein Vretifemale_18912 [Volvox reticuliferus]